MSDHRFDHDVLAQEILERRDEMERARMGDPFRDDEDEEDDRCSEVVR